MDYVLIRSDRKTVSIIVRQDGTVEVRAPRRTSRQYIDDFVKSKEQWILSHQQKALEEIPKDVQTALQPGDYLMFCGEPLEVRFGTRNAVQMDVKNRIITVPHASNADIASAVRYVYRRGGIGFIEKRLNEWAGRMDITYTELKMSSAVQRWGSCGADGVINISWILLFAPMSAIDYVLVHELAHRKEFNHSKRFWSIVAQYIPDYPEQKKILDRLHRTLSAEGWIS